MLCNVSIIKVYRFKYIPNSFKEVCLCMVVWSRSISVQPWPLYSRFDSSLLRAIGSNANTKSGRAREEMNGISDIVFVDFVTIDFAKGSARRNMIAAANGTRTQSMQLDTSLKDTFFVKCARNTATLKIGISSVAKESSASRMAHDITDRGSLTSVDKSSVASVLLRILMLPLRARVEILIV